MKSVYRGSAVLLTIMIAAVWGNVAAAQTEIVIFINDIEVEPIENEAAYQITIYTTVMDPEGRFIPGLSIEDFQISEDGVIVGHASVEAVERDAAMVLVLDTSGSMTGSNTAEAVRQAAISLIGSLDSGDQIGIIYFNDQVVEAFPLSDDLSTST